MKMKALMAALVAVAMIGSAFAQGAGPKGGQGGTGKRGPGGPGGMRRGGPMNFDGPILEKLALTADQKAKVKALKEKLGKSMKDGMSKNQGDREAMRKSIREYGKTYRDGLMKILTPAQQKSYKTLAKAEMEKRRKEMGNRRPGGPGGPPPPSAN